ncbi:uncharacterized protein [Amphiura filiformis]|uniref:uncharacterized protein n=1 Tax=Amphiura filiformis TaxID=82378 RepID=UPI003B222663
MGFATYDTLKEHNYSNLFIQNSHSTCDHCKRGFGKDSSLKKHLKTPHSVDFATKDNQQQTRKKVSQISVAYECDKCTKRFLTLAKFDHHECISDSQSGSAHQGSDAEPKCNHCNMRLAATSDVARHEKRPRKRQHSLLRWMCRKCGMGFGTNDDLNEHKTIHKASDTRQPHEDETEYRSKVASSLVAIECDKCRQQFPSLVRFTLHKCISDTRNGVAILRATSIPRKRNSHPQCEHCNKHFGTKPNLESPVDALSLATKDNLEKNNKFIPLIQLHSHFPCSLCSASFWSQRGLNIHARVAHPECPCTICGKCFMSKEEWTRHDQMCVRNIGNNDKGVPRSLGAHGQGAVRGPLTTPLSALMSFSPLHRAPEPSGPMDFVHPVHPLAMPLNNDDSPKIPSFHQCNKAFKSQTSLQKHVNNHEHNQKRETEMCMYCDMKLKGKLSLTVHKKRHGGETPFECMQCLEKFSSREELTQHRTSHVDKKALSCHRCNKGLKSRKNLLMHIKNCECNKRGEMVCMYCDRKVKGKMGLASHMKTHVGETPFECKQCGDEFASREELTQHRTNHVDDKIALKCHHCVKTFPSLLKLQRHLGEISTGFKCTRSKCNKCGKGFASNYRRDIHMREAHTGEDIFRCTNCRKKFLQESELSQHVETGCQSLKCQECDKFFKRKSFLKDHIISMHPKEKPPHLQHVECKYCLKSLSSERQLQRHIKSIHEIAFQNVNFMRKCLPWRNI